MTISDGTDTFKGNQVTGDKLDVVGVWHGATTPTNPLNEIPNKGLFLNTTTGQVLENTGTVAAPVFVLRIAAANINSIIVAKHSTTIGDYIFPAGAPTTIAFTNPIESESATPKTKVNHGGDIVAAHASIRSHTSTAIDATGPEAVTGSSAYFGKTANAMSFKFKRLLGGLATHLLNLAIFNAAEALVGETYFGRLTDFPTSNTVKELIFPERVIAVGDKIVIHSTGTRGAQGLDHFYESTAGDVFDGADTDRAERNAGTWSLGGRDHFGELFESFVAQHSTNDSASRYETQSSTNPEVDYDFGEQKPMGGVAIKRHANDTMDDYEIFTSPDNSVFTKVRTVLASDLTAGSNVFIRFTVPSSDTRYIRLRGVGTAKIMAISEFRGLVLTEDKLMRNHAHFQISATDKTLNLDGT